MPTKQAQVEHTNGAEEVGESGEGNRRCCERPAKIEHFSYLSFDLQHTRILQKYTTVYYENLQPNIDVSIDFHTHFEHLNRPFKC